MVNRNRKTLAPSYGAVTELVIIPYLNLSVFLTDKMRFYINVKYAQPRQQKLIKLIKIINLIYLISEWQLLKNLFQQLVHRFQIFGNSKVNFRSLKISPN